MDWILEDWEYPNDHIYAIEKEHDIQVACQQWEEAQESKNRLPAIIKVQKPILIDENKLKPRTVSRAH